MATFKKGDLDPKTFPHTLKGFYVREGIKNLVVAKSPKYSNAKNPSRIWNEQQFAIAARMAASPQWLDQISAIQVSKGTEQVPRDVLMMAIYGNLVSLLFPDGTMSTVADHSRPQPTPPEQEETMLVWSQQAQAWNTAMSGSAYCYKGAVITPQATMTLSGMQSIATLVANGLYSHLVCQVDTAGKIVSTPVTSRVRPVSGGLQAIRTPLSMTLVNGSRYFVALGRIDQGGTYALPIYWSAAQNWLGPIWTHGAYRIAKVDPALGDTLDNAASPNVPPFGLEVSF